MPPANVNLIQSTPLTTQEAHITWEPLNDNQWNGLDTDREYIVELTDIGTNRVITDTTHPSVTSYTFTNLEVIVCQLYTLITLAGECCWQNMLVICFF